MGGWCVCVCVGGGGGGGGRGEGKWQCILLSSCPFISPFNAFWISEWGYLIALLIDISCYNLVMLKEM